MLKRYSKAEALKIIKGSIIPTAHLKQRMQEKRFDMQDVLHAIKNGNIFREAEPTPPERQMDIFNRRQND